MQRLQHLLLSCLACTQRLAPCSIRLFCSSFLLAGCLSGCANGLCCTFRTAETPQSIRYLVIGLGVVTIADANESSAIVAARVNALGLTVTDQPGIKFNLGYAASSLIAIPPSIKDAIVEVGECTPGGITIKSSLPQSLSN